MDAERREQQNLIDAEIRASRRDVLEVFRDRLRADPETLVAPDFLALADEQVIRTAIMICAAAAADACALRIRDPNTGTLRLARHRGLSPAVVESLVTDDDERPEEMRDAGFRAVLTYPLQDEQGALLGVLTLHHHTDERRPGHERLVTAAARALARPRRPDEPPAVEISVDVAADGVTTVVLQGAIDSVTAPGCAVRLRAAGAGLGSGDVLVVDLRAVDFLGAAGVRMLLDVARSSEIRAVSSYFLAGAGHIVRTVLDRADARPPLNIVADETGLIAARRPQPG